MLESYDPNEGCRYYPGENPWYSEPVTVETKEDLTALTERQRFLLREVQASDSYVRRYGTDARATLTTLAQRGLVRLDVHPDGDDESCKTDAVDAKRANTRRLGRTQQAVLVDLLEQGAWSAGDELAGYRPYLAALTVEELFGRGLVERYAPWPRNRCYVLTEAGKAAARELAGLTTPDSASNAT